MSEVRLDRVQELSSRICPILAGQGGDVQGAVLAELVSRWLAGHQEDSPEKTAELRERLLAMHLEYVRKLTQVWDEENANA